MPRAIPSGQGNLFGPVPSFVRNGAPYKARRADFKKESALLAFHRTVFATRNCYTQECRQCEIKPIGYDAEHVPAPLSPVHQGDPPVAPHYPPASRQAMWIGFSASALRRASPAPANRFMISLNTAGDLYANSRPVFPFRQPSSRR